MVKDKTADSTDSKSVETNQPRNRALRFAFVYAVTGAVWIVLSDQFVDWFFDEHSSTVIAQTLKGSLFVVATFLIVYWLSLRAFTSIQQHALVQELDDTQHLLDVVLGNLGDAIFVIDPATRAITRCNAAATKVFGYTESEMIGQSTEMLHIDHDSYKEFGAIGEPRLEESNVFRCPYRMKRRDGTIIDVEVTVVSLDPSLGWKTGVVGIVRDITKQTKAYKALEESERAYRLLAENTLDVIWSMRPSLEFDYVNPAVESVTGHTVEEFLGSRLQDHTDEKQFQRLSTAIATQIESGPDGKGTIVETELIHKDGSPIPVEVHGKAFFDEDRNFVGLQGTARPISDRLMLEAQLRQAQKLEAIGTLAAGIAHEINNPMAVIEGYAELLSRRTLDSDHVHDYGAKISHETKRVDSIIHNLLGYARTDDGSETVTIDIGEPIEAVTSLVATSFRYDGIELSIDIPDTLPKPRVHFQRIQQVIMNLLTNARDAINARSSDLDTAKRINIYATMYTDSDGAWIRTTVEDTGTGIAEGVQKRIFDPFFTTKARGKGTGLGLWISYRIVKDLGGRITVESEPGEFTKFHVDLPLDQFSETG